MRRTPIQRRSAKKSAAVKERWRKTLSDRMQARLAKEEAWHQIKAAVWARDGGKCVFCKASVALYRSDCHHRKLRSQGGQDEHPVLVTLCRRHHQLVHQYPAWSCVVGLIVPSWAEPVEWPVLTRLSTWTDPVWAVPGRDDLGEWTWIVAAPHPDQHDEPAPWERAA